MALRKKGGRPSVNSSRTRSQARSSSTARSGYTSYEPQGNSFMPEDAQQYGRMNPQYSKTSKKGFSKGKKIAIAIACSMVIVAVGCGTALAYYVNSVNQSLAGTRTEEEKQDIADVLVPRTDFTEPFYMMLIGSDARIGDASSGERSDTNILARIDPVQGAVTIISIPRDTKIELEGYGTNKFNAAYAYKGVAGTIEEASKLCGVDIAHYAEVNFETLVELVDILGGVEVDVPTRINDSDAGNIVIEEGLQTLDGEASLVFARSRKYLDGDFTRTSSQRLLMEAIITKTLSLPATELPGVIQEAAKSVTTDFTVTDLVNLALQFQDISNLSLYSAMLPSTSATIDGLSYAITDPQALVEFMALVEAGQDPSSIVGTYVYSGGDSSTDNSQSSNNNSGGYSNSGGSSGYVPEEVPSGGGGEENSGGGTEPPSGGDGGGPSGGDEPSGGGDGGGEAPVEP